MPFDYLLKILLENNKLINHYHKNVNLSINNVA